MEKTRTYDFAVIGHLCLDIIPAFKTNNVPLSEVLVPGKLVEVEGMALATGGAASNVGLALHKLGFAVRLIGKIGDDMLGQLVADVINAAGEGLAGDLIVGQGGTTSYTVVINPPGVDRMFLHSPGTNDTFRTEEVADEILAGAAHMHFGYPPLMRAFYADGGAELRSLMLRAKAAGCSTSLDMARPDPDGDSGKVDWRRYMERVLPTVDIFLPSIDEIVFMLDPPRFDELAARGGNVADFMRFEEFGAYADVLLGMGAAVVGFKLGDRGFYLKTSEDEARLDAIPVFTRDMVAAWRGAEVYAPCREVEVAGTTGAGDCTIAGFLGGVLRGLPPGEAAGMAVSAGGAGVEALGAADGVPAWDALRERIAAGWQFRPCEEPGTGWVRSAGGIFQKGEV